MLQDLIAKLQTFPGILHKKDIQAIAQKISHYLPVEGRSPILLGDDCAAIPDGDGYLLLASEGMWPVLVEEDPWFAGWCSVLVNVSDIYAMGGRPIAVVDALWTRSVEHSLPIIEGMRAASEVFNVPIVGGHTNCHSSYDGLSVSILGRSQSLITSFNARLGDQMVLLTNLNGRPHPTYPFWDAATQADPQQLLSQLELLPAIADQGLCTAGKDVSMGGIIGTTLMLLEASHCGAILDVECIPVPVGLSLDQWLISFPSYGFLLTVSPSNVPVVKDLAASKGLICNTIGTIIDDLSLLLKWGQESCEFWNIAEEPLTGFGEQRLDE